jgi:L-rhamnose isomerase/sugar isomerase
VINCQVAYAKALIVNYGELAQAQLAGDVLGAHRAVTTAFEADVRPLLARVREEKGLNPDPIAAYRADDYASKVAQVRGKSVISGGFPSA